jgi:hypothetical protein
MGKKSSVLRVLRHCCGIGNRSRGSEKQIPVRVSEGLLRVLLHVSGFLYLPRRKVFTIPLTSITFVSSSTRSNTVEN